MAGWLEQATNALNALPVHETVRDLEWVVPAVQTLHILAVGVVFSASLVIALRALGLAGTSWTLGRWQRRLGPWTAGALVLLLLTGCVMILAEPERELLNSLFQIKIPLVILTTILSFALGHRFSRGQPRRPVSGATIIGAIIVLALWGVIMGLGRWIAYAG